MNHSERISPILALADVRRKREKRRKRQNQCAPLVGVICMPEVGLVNTRDDGWSIYYLKRKSLMMKDGAEKNERGKESHDAEALGGYGVALP
jgi:hypothetical protein